MRLPSIVTDLVSKIRRDEVAFPAQAGMLELLGAPNTRYDYAKRVVPMQNSALAAGVNFFAQMFSEAPVAVFDATDGQPGEVKEGHDPPQLIAQLGKPRLVSRRGPDIHAVNAHTIQHVALTGLTDQLPEAPDDPPSDADHVHVNTIWLALADRLHH